MKAEGSYKVKKWDETSYDEISPTMKMTKASVEFAFTGDLEGTGAVEYLMYYRYFDAADQNDSTAVFVGLCRYQGSVAGRTGSFVMEDRGIYADRTADSTLRIIEGSGSGELARIHGSGRCIARPGSFRIELDYTV